VLQIPAICRPIYACHVGDSVATPAGEKIYTGLISLHQCLFITQVLWKHAIETVSGRIANCSLRFASWSFRPNATRLASLTIRFMVDPHQDGFCIQDDSPHKGLCRLLQCQTCSSIHLSQLYPTNKSAMYPCWYTPFFFFFFFLRLGDAVARSDVFRSCARSIVNARWGQYDELYGEL